MLVHVSRRALSENASCVVDITSGACGFQPGIDGFKAMRVATIRMGELIGLLRLELTSARIAAQL